MVRAAAKNHASVAVVVEPLGYDGCWPPCVVADSRWRSERSWHHWPSAHRRIRHRGGELDRVDAGAGGGHAPADLPRWFRLQLASHVHPALRENPHQQAALYSDDVGGPAWRRSSSCTEKR